jgi:hypothetical protein
MAGSDTPFPVSSLYFQEAFGRRRNRPLAQIASERFDPCRTLPFRPARPNRVTSFGRKLL